MLESVVVTISVIVPAYNAQKTISQTIRSLVEQDYSEKYEIIVIDDGSTDQTADLIRSFPNVIYVHQPNAGPATARNHGARLAKGRYLAFTDSDCVPHKDWLSQLLQGFMKDDIAVVMGSYGIVNKENFLAYCIYKEIVFRHDHLLPDFPIVFGSYNFCIKKEVFDQVGGFSTSYRHASGEDNDLSYKIIHANWRIYFQRKALVDHYHPTRILKYLKEQFRHGFWRVRMYAAYPSMSRGDGYTFWKDIIEVPWSSLCLLGIVLTPLGLTSFIAGTSGSIILLLFFEISFARSMFRNVQKEIFWGFIMFLRAFSRALGLSTGILSFLGLKILNKC